MTDTSFETIKHEAQKRHAHARTCKSDPMTCKQCIDNRRYFDALPLEQLARVLDTTTK